MHSQLAMLCIKVIINFRWCYITYCPCTSYVIPHTVCKCTIAGCIVGHVLQPAVQLAMYYSWLCSWLCSWPCNIAGCVAGHVLYLAVQLAMYYTWLCSWSCTIAGHVLYLAVQLAMYYSWLCGWPCTIIKALNISCIQQIANYFNTYSVLIFCSNYWLQHLHIKIAIAICYYSKTLYCNLYMVTIYNKETVNKALAINLHIKDKQYNCMYIIQYLPLFTQLQLANQLLKKP